ncbi:MAG: hypothetical protein KDC26_05985 [Armatimonadetes bacterium]|nr:hypothetical protein [Armatimonadota bacterium]
MLCKLWAMSVTILLAISIGLYAKKIKNDYFKERCFSVLTEFLRDGTRPVVDYSPEEKEAMESFLRDKSELEMFFVRQLYVPGEGCDFYFRDRNLNGKYMVHVSPDGSIYVDMNDFTLTTQW